MLNTMKDKALSKGAKIALNTYISKYGNITKLSLNSRFKSMNLEIFLDGDSQPINVHIENYELVEKNSTYSLKISGIKTSKSWINTLAYEHLEAKEFSIPYEFATMLKAIIGE